METELTKSIKKATHFYAPKLNSKMRTIRYADEVWTPTGIVDSIRFEDYYDSDYYTCPPFDADSYTEKQLKNYEILRPNKSIPVKGFCWRTGFPDKDESNCRSCVFRHHVYHVGMMITCYEVKISLSDFRSKNGHNFHGNENYYCVPKGLIDKILPLVPDDIGILSYNESKASHGLRMVKPAIWRDVDDATKIQLLYNAMKKWCDGTMHL